MKAKQHQLIFIKQVNKLTKKNKKPLNKNKKQKIGVKINTINCRKNIIKVEDLSLSMYKIG